jgi:hypothetical protein
MARLVKTASGILNIALHPHSPEIYAAFIEDIYELRHAVKIRGERYGIISLLHRRGAGEREINGILTTFTRVGVDSRWFDVSHLKEATTAQLRQIVIPDGLFPNPKAFYFSFDLRQHRLYFQHYTEGDTLTHASAQKVFEALADQEAIRRKYGGASITVVQSKRGLKSLLSLPVIRELKVTIFRPNPDVFADDFEQQIAAHLEATRSRKLEVSYVAERGESIIPNDEIRRLGEFALQAGKVVVTGRDHQGGVKLSTDKFPATIAEKYDPEAESDYQAFRRTTGERRAG